MSNDHIGPAPLSDAQTKWIVIPAKAGIHRSAGFESKVDKLADAKEFGGMDTPLSRSVTLFSNERCHSPVTLGLVPGVHGSGIAAPWIVGTSPTMTKGASHA